MACDSLESLKMVDSQGRNLAVNRRENSDLLDASCGGGGGNFGARAGGVAALALAAAGRAAWGRLLPKVGCSVGGPGPHCALLTWR